MSDEQGGAQLNPSIVVLRTGEKLITILQEVFEGEGDDKKGVCLVMNYPYELTLLAVDGADEAQDLQVKYSKWCPFSTDAQYRIPYDGILTIGVPDVGLSGAYMQKVEEQKKITEQNNENYRLQQEAVAEALAAGGAQGMTNTAGVGATEEHPVAEPFEVVDAEVAEV